MLVVQFQKCSDEEVNSNLKQLYTCNKMEHFSYCGVSGQTTIEAFKEELPWAIDKRLWVNT